MPADPINCPTCSREFVPMPAGANSPVICPFCHQIVRTTSRKSGGGTQQKRNTIKSAPGLSPKQLLKDGMGKVRGVMDEFKQMGFRQEVLPIDETNVQLLMKDFTFWAVTALGTIPLLIITVESANSQLTLFALFFAFVWGVIFKKFILRDRGSWQLPIATLFFTGLVGIWLLLFLYRHFLPDFYLNMADSKNPLVSLLGFVLQVGVWEELLKALPLLLVLKIFKGQVGAFLLVSIGVFSGLGFAAFENLHYGDRAIASATSLTLDYGQEGLVYGVQNAMVNAMLRAVSLVFCHAVFSGIVAYFVARAQMSKQHAAALIILGIGVAALLHGLYDWLAGIQPTIAALLAGFSFVLFYGYLSKLRQFANPPLSEESDNAPQLGWL